jgi:Ca2+-binding EF-hand superfamily protein
MKTTSIQNLRAHFAMTEMFKYYCKLITSSLGCCPSEAEIQEILVAAEDEETSGSVKLDRFLSTVSHIIQEKRFVSK